MVMQVVAGVTPLGFSMKTEKEKLQGEDMAHINAHSHTVSCII